MRAFVALEVSEEVLGSLISFQDDIRSTGADLKLVEKENLHFTIKFLGDISDSQASVAASKLSALMLQSAEVEVRGAGAFPGLPRPKVVWAGVAREHEGLVSAIAESVAASLRGIGQREERPFRAHITLARVRSPRNSRELAGLLERNSERPFGKTRLAALKLKSSTLTSLGPTYSDIGAFPLA